MRLQVLLSLNDENLRCLMLKGDKVCEIVQIVILNMSDSQSQSNTQQLALDCSALNYAHIHSPNELDSTPSTRKCSIRNKKMKNYKNDSESSDDEWSYLLTKSMAQQSVNECTPDRKGSKAKEGEKKSGKIDKTADIKNKKGCKQDNMCPVCLAEIKEVRGSLDCGHQFCFECIQEWCQTSTICPCCRTPIKSIVKLVKSANNKLVKEMERVQVQPKQLVFQSEYDFYTCYQCGLGDNEHVLLICDGCDFNCCHVYCDQELNSQIPDEDWYCIHCRQSRKQKDTATQQEDEDVHSEKAVASRTRSRHSIGSNNMNNNLVALRNIRRNRR